MSRQEEAQAELTNLRRIWRTMLERQRNMTPAEKEAQAARHRAEAKERTEAYRAQLVAAKERECAAPVDVRFRLEQAGVEPQHLQGLKALDERYAFLAARRWWTQAKVATGELRAAAGEDGELVRQPVLVRRWPFLLLLGSTGQGKTQAAAWCLGQAVRGYPWESRPTGTSARRPFVVWHGTAMASTALWGNHSPTVMGEAVRTWEEAERASVLVLDDLFPKRQPMSGPHTDRLAALLTARHGAHRATIITANMDSPTLARLLDGQETGGPLWRRVSEGGIVVTLRDRGAPAVLRGGVAADWKAK
jgi:hypothetical protein